MTATPDSMRQLADRLYTEAGGDGDASAVFGRFLADAIAAAADIFSGSDPSPSRALDTLLGRVRLLAAATEALYEAGDDPEPDDAPEDAEPWPCPAMAAYRDGYATGRRVAAAEAERGADR